MHCRRSKDLKKEESRSILGAFGDVAGRPSEEKTTKPALQVAEAAGAAKGGRGERGAILTRLASAGGRARGAPRDAPWESRLERQPSRPGERLLAQREIGRLEEAPLLLASRLPLHSHNGRARAAPARSPGLSGPTRGGNPRPPPRPNQPPAASCAAKAADGEPRPLGRSAPRLATPPEPRPDSRARLSGRLLLLLLLLLRRAEARRSEAKRGRSGGPG